MTSSPPALFADAVDRFEALALSLDDPRPHPPQAALLQLGQALMTELLDLLADTALEDYQTTLAESLIGAFHSAAQRIERDADRARDELSRLVRDFHGSEVDDSNLQEATRRAHAADVAVLAAEAVRDAAAATYTVGTGEVWTPWRGSVKASCATAAQIEARAAIRAAKTRRAQALDPGREIVALRAAPSADTAIDAGRIFDALNWARQTWPSMCLATTGARGGEALAIKWAKGAGVPLVLARADFDRNGRSAPFRANDELLELEPVCVLTLARSLDPSRGQMTPPFGPALNLAQKAQGQGVRSVPIAGKA
ncbi:DUF2493 domain-containing protein [Caulobacter segnis]